jgi:hypothetical protein
MCASKFHYGMGHLKEGISYKAMSDVIFNILPNVDE